MKLVAPDLKELELIDDVIDEPTGGAHHEHEATALSFRESVARHLAEVSALSVADLLESRYQKFRKFGDWVGKP